jgi:serine protease Do
MKQKFFPVVLTAAITSVTTMFAINHFQNKTNFWGSSNTGDKLPVHYTAYNADVAAANAKAAPDFQLAAEASVKAVVHIKTTINAKTVMARDPISELFGGDMLRQFRTPEQMGSGSGVVISPDGYIVTNNHVISGTDQIVVTFDNRKTAKAKLIGSDPSSDLAVLKIEEKDLPYVEFGNSDDVHLGQWVLAVGYPLSLDATVTAGIVSAKSRSIGINAQQSRSAIESFIQTDAAVNPGNSGGPLVNAMGQIVGINAAIASPTGSYAGYSYAIPANIVKKVAADIIQYGAVQRAYLGIETRDFKNATPQEISKFGLDKNVGVYVAKVAPQSGAMAAGIKEGDFIAAINNVPINSFPQLTEQISRFKPGDHISVSYLRNGKTINTNVELKNKNGTTDVVKEKPVSQILGAQFRSLSTQELKKYNITGGLQITDLGNGLLAQQTNIKKGFVVSGVNGNPVKDAASLDQLLSGQNVSIQLEGFYPGSNGMYYYNLRSTEDPN